MSRNHRPAPPAYDRPAYDPSDYEAPAYEAPARAPPEGAPMDVQGALRSIQSHFADLARARDELAENVRSLEESVERANAELAALRAERDHLTRLKSLYERKFASIRELTQQ